MQGRATRQDAAGAATNQDDLALRGHAHDGAGQVYDLWIGADFLFAQQAFEMFLNPGPRRGGQIVDSVLAKSPFLRNVLQQILAINLPAESFARALADR